MPTKKTSKRKAVPDVVERFRTALNECKGNWARLSSLSKGKLTYKWLTMFAKGEIKDPSFRKLETLGKFIGMKVTITAGAHFMKFVPEE